jgi:hypothetical protein
MTIAQALSAVVLCVSVCAAAQDRNPTVLACNLKAISVADRPRYNNLMKQLRNAIQYRSELSNGYAFKLDGKAISLPDVAEWISMERLCCPFLTLQLSASGNQADWVLNLMGPEGVKQILDAEFPTIRK